MLARYAPPPPTRILDIGCGAGRVTAALAPRGYDVVGLDITAAMVQAARALTAQHGVRGDFAQGDLCDLSFAAESFDLALIFIAALQHVAGRAARRDALRQIARVLKRDGVLILALDNIAPALGCYLSWAVQKVLSPESRVRSQIFNSSPRADVARGIIPTPNHLTTQPPNHPSADIVLTSNRSRMSAIAWHARGLARSLRWRTWEGVRDAGRAVRLARGEAGDTFIHQVSMPPTDGKVYYHLYRHDELVNDAQVAGLRLLGYHSGRELAEGKTFGEAARRLDKQVMYAFRKSFVV